MSGISSSRLPGPAGVPGAVSKSAMNPGTASASARCCERGSHCDMRLAMAVVVRRVASAAAARAAA
eukprot:5280034-Alexandrium_andersonii.AAC.1